MTDWELQQVTNTIVMAHETRLMPTISAMLIALSDERAALLKSAKAYVYASEDDRLVALSKDLIAAIEKAES